jgi:hypothetical protein
MCAGIRSRVQIKALDWVTVHRRKLEQIYALYKAYSREPARKGIGDITKAILSESRADHDWKIRNRRQGTDIGKHSFVNRTIQLWNKLPMNALGTFPFKLNTFRKRVRKVISEGNSK